MDEVKNDRCENTIPDRQRIHSDRQILEAVFSSEHFLMAFMDRRFDFIRVNRGYAAADGRTPDYYLGKNHFDLYPDPENEAIFREVVETGLPYSAFEKPFVYPQHPERGTTYWDWLLQPLKNAQGAVEGVVLILVDVTERRRAREAEHQSELRYRALFEESRDAVYIVTRDGCFIDVNRSAQELFGYDRKELMGLNILDLYWEPTDRPRFQENIERDGSVHDYGIVFRKRDGSRIHCLLTSSVMETEEGDIWGYQGIIRDITEQKEAERRKRFVNDLLELFLHATSRTEYLDAVVRLLKGWTDCRCIGIRMVRPDGRLPYESYIGFSEAFWAQENWLSVRTDHCACTRVATGCIEPQDRQVMSSGGSFCCNNTFEFVGDLTAQEQSRFRGVCVQNGFATVAVVPIRYRDETLGALHFADEAPGMMPLPEVEFTESITPLIGEAILRFNMEEELRRSGEELRHLSSQLLSAQEKERRLVAQELHDSIGQTLAALKFSAEKTLSEPGGLTGAQDGLRSLVSMIKNAINEVRRIEKNLWPPTLEILGLVTTIQIFCKEYQSVYSHIRVDQRIDIQEDRIPWDLKIVIFRIVQEALHNIAKHSRAEQAMLVLSENEDRIELSVEDDGRGFDLGSVSSRRSDRRGLGLASMKERAEMSGGTWTIASEPNAGTRVYASWPIE